MIIDRIANGTRYESLNPAFAASFKFLHSPELRFMPTGTYDLGTFRAIVFEGACRGLAGARLERHEHQIDIHCPIDVPDLIGWKDAAACLNPIEPFDPVMDIGKFSDEPDIWVPVPPGCFAIYFPSDGHAPLGGAGEIRKVILKVPE